MFWFPDKIKGFSTGIVIRECSQTRDEIFPALDCSQFFPPFIACKTDVETQFGSRNSDAFFAHEF